MISVKNHNNTETFFDHNVILSDNDYKLYIEPIIRENLYNDPYEYVDAFRECLEESRSDLKKKEVCKLFRFICFFSFVPSNNESPFLPMIKKLTEDSGKPCDIPSNHLEFLQKIVGDIVNSAIQARVADVLWVVNKNANVKYNAAEIAIESYMALIEHMITSSDLLPLSHDIIQRILYLSRWRKSDKHKKIIQKVVELIKNQTTWTASYLGEIVLLLWADVDGTDKNSLFVAVHNKVNDSSKDDLAVLEKLCHKLGKTEEANNCKIQQAKIMAKFGDSPGSDALEKVNWYEESLQICPRTTETIEFIKETNTKLANASKDGHEEMQIVKIPPPKELISRIKEKLKQVREYVSGSNFPAALEKLLSCLNYPTVENLKNGVKDEEKNLLGIFSPVFSQHDVSSVNSQDRCTSIEFSCEEEKLALYFKMRNYDREIINIILIDGLEAIRRENNIKGTCITERDWIAIISKCHLIPEERVQSFVAGFHNWFYKKNHIAMPILIPQFENLLRYHIQEKGVDTSIYRNKERRQEEDSLKNNLEKDSIKALLGEDLVLQFKILLVAKDGYNLRHRTAHGLISDTSFLGPEWDYFVLLILKLLMRESFDLCK